MATISAAKKSYVPRFKSWSASRLDDHDQCPFKAKLKHLDKLCPLCYAGKLSGGFDTPAVCDSCGGTPTKGDALVRGGDIGDALDKYLLGKSTKPGATILHPQVKEIVKNAKADIKKKQGAVQINLRFTSSWEVIPGDGYDPSAWLYAKLDYRRITGDAAHVTDWKTGGVDKKTGEVKVVDKYDDQLLIYNVATLISCPAVNVTTSDLVFLDCKPPFDPVLEREGLNRRDLKAAQRKLEKRALPLLSDTVFAPKASYACTYCDFSKRKGGPCKF